MQKLSFLVRLNPYQELELNSCTELPDFLHMVKSYPEEGLELFFDGAFNWTAALEEAAEKLLQAYLIYT